MVSVKHNKSYCFLLPLSERPWQLYVEHRDSPVRSWHHHFGGLEYVRGGQHKSTKAKLNMSSKLCTSSNPGTHEGIRSTSFRRESTWSMGALTSPTMNCVMAKLTVNIRLTTTISQISISCLGDATNGRHCLPLLYTHRYQIDYESKSSRCHYSNR